MAKILNKDPLTFQQEKAEFLKELHNFHRNRGTPFDRLPKIGGREIDLYLLYRRVISFGGLRKIHDEETWNSISYDLRLPSGCCNGSQALKHVYVRYLDKYERVHFHGEDPNKRDFDDDSDHAPARKKVKLPLYGIPLFYNHEQHRLTDAVREMHGLSQDLTASSDYEKLEQSLISGLPNEVDFVINICTLLSNEGRHILRLDQSRYLLTLLMAHIGLFDYNKDGLELLYENGWCQFSKRNYVRFWLDTVKDDSAKMLISSTRDCKLNESIGETVLNIGRDLGVKDKEGQRVTQLAVIIRNLSFQDENCKFMASNDLVFRFLILCINCQYGSLRQLALDTFGNLAEKLIIDDDADKNLILDLISKCITSSDKFDVVRGLEILGKMCQIPENELHIAEGLDESIYSQLIQLACVFDIQLIVHSLETLYQLSELGEETSTKIAAVKNAVDLLVTLLSIEAQSYGPNSLIGIKVVEYCPPTGAPDTRKLHEGSPVPHKVLPIQQAPQPVPSTTNSVPVAADIESTTRNWLQTAYEIKGDCAITQMVLYAEYVQFCRKTNLPQILPSQSFHNTVKVVFPNVQVVASDRPDGSKELSYHGLFKRPPNQQPQGTVSKPSGLSDLTHTPMLRQRLMDPPRLSPLQASPSLLPVGGVPSNHSNSPVQPVLPAGTKSKALLQAKLQQNQQQQQPPPPPRFVQQQTVVQQGWIANQTVGPHGAIIQVSAVKNDMMPQAQNLPVVIEGLSADHQNKPIETKMIKNLLAKKLRPPQSTPVPIYPKSPKTMEQTGNQVHLLTTKMSEPAVNQVHLLKVSESVSNPMQLLKVSEPVTNPMQLLTFTAQQSNMIQDHIQNQPIIPKVIIQQTSPARPPSAKSPVPARSPIQAKSSKSPSRKAEKSPAKAVEPSQKPSTPEGKRKGTRSSARVVSPKSRSTRHSPKSPKTYDLDVCGKIERAKDLTQIGIEAKIEHVENKSVNNDPSPECRTSENQNISPNSAVKSSQEISSTSHFITNDSHQTSLSELHQSSSENNTSNIVSVNNISTQNNEEKLTNGIEDKLLLGKVCDTPLVNGEVKSPEIIPSPTGLFNGENIQNTEELKQAINKIADIKAGKLNGAIYHKVDIGHNGGNLDNIIMNGSVAVESPEKNSVTSCVQSSEDKSEKCKNSTKESIETTKENILENCEKETHDTKQVSQCDENTIHYDESINNESDTAPVANEGAVVINSDDMAVNEDVNKKDLVVGEGQQLVIESNGSLQVNGSEISDLLEINGTDAEEPVQMNGPDPNVSVEINGTDSLLMEAPAETSDIEVIKAVNSIPLDTDEAPIVKNQSLNSSRMIQPASDLETIDAVNSILEPQETSDESYMENTSHCYELAGEPSEEEMETDEVIIENEMMLQPSKPPPSEPSSTGENTLDSDLLIIGDQSSDLPSAIPENNNQSVPSNEQSVVINHSSSQSNETVVYQNPSTENLPVTVQQGDSVVLISNEQPIVNIQSEPIVPIKPESQNKNISAQSENEEARIRITNEVCITRHVPTPESSRDNELSCDSFASSNTDSDKHSMPSPVTSQNFSIIQTNVKPRSKTPENKKSKKRSRSGSGDSRCSSTTTVIQLEYMCEWSGCKRCFENAKSVYCHVYKIHLSRNPEGYCLWDGCEKLLRKRWSLATHVQDHHCSDTALQNAAIRRFQATQTGTQAQNPRIPALVYPPDAAWQAIRRFTPKPPYPEFQEPREGPVTKHIRLTAALILRNLARYSSYGRSLIKKHESHINYTAMSAVESSTALANCLWEILHDTC